MLSIVFCASAYAAFIVTKEWLSQIPTMDNFLYYRPLQTTYFYDTSQNIIGCASLEWRDVLATEDVENLLVARIVVGMEDERFFERDLPVDVRAVLRAFRRNAEAGRVIEGGSTIEQQLVKQLLPPEERKNRSIIRKLKELVMGFYLMGEFTKPAILTLYLNEVYLGHNRHGIEAAALFYFNKHARDLSVSEAATIAGLIPAPELYSPRKHPQAAILRRNMVLAHVHSIGVISAHEYYAALREPIRITNEFLQQCRREPYVVRHARRELRERFRFFMDEEQKNPMWYGLRVTTTLDPSMQEMANAGVANALGLYHMRRKEKAVDANAAMIVLENKTGAIRAMIGSRNPAETQFNHATQAHRQSGSAFKPLVYAAYITKKIEERNADPEALLRSRISNARFSCGGATRSQKWSPKNFDDRKSSASSYSLIEAVVKSINRPALHAAELKKCTLDLGVIITARRMGIESALGSMEGNALRFRLPIAIGAADLTLLELTRAYMVFPNGGAFMRDRIIDRITRKDGMPVYQFMRPELEPAIRCDVANAMVEVLREVTKRGTASSMKLIPQPTAGKTGTTNHFTDALFVGFTPTLTAGVWVGGKDKTVSLGYNEVGGKTALPAFKQFVGELYTEKPVEDFPPLTTCQNIPQ